MESHRKARHKEIVRLQVYQRYYLWVALLSMGITSAMHFGGLIQVIVSNASALSMTGVQIAAFIFAVQGIMLAIPASNPFIQSVREEGHYFVFIHKFCRLAEAIFLLLLFPMLYMTNDSMWLNMIVVTAYLIALLLTIWAMWLMGELPPIIVPKRELVNADYRHENLCYCLAVS